MWDEDEIDALLADEVDEQRIKNWRDKFQANMPYRKGLYMRASIELCRRSAIAASLAGLSREEWMRQLIIREICETLGDDPETLSLGLPPPRINETDIARSRRIRYGNRSGAVSTVDPGSPGESAGASQATG